MTGFIRTKIVLKKIIICIFKESICWDGVIKLRVYLVCPKYYGFYTKSRTVTYCNVNIKYISTWYPFWHIYMVNSLGLGDLATILNVLFLNEFQWYVQMNATGHYRWQINIALGDGLVPLGNKSIPGPMLIKIYDRITRSQMGVGLNYQQQ